MSGDSETDLLIGSVVDGVVSLQEAKTVDKVESLARGVA